MDKAAQENFLIPEDLMMENAACALEKLCLEELKKTNTFALYRPSVLILCGCRNNGADGYALARRLMCEKYSVSVCSFGEGKSELAKIQKERAKKIGVNIFDFLELDNFLEEKSIDLKLIVDCIFGSGFHGNLPPQVSAVLSEINKIEDARKIACDLPSGLDKFGNADANVFIADKTLTMGSLKYCLFTSAAKDCAGEISLCNLGVSQDNFESLSKPDAFLLEKTDMRLPIRKKQNVNKGNFGHVGIALGEKKGAAVIAGSSALRFGAGLVSLISLNNEEISFSSELMSVKDFPSNINVLAIGMGLGRDEENFTKYFDFILEHKNLKCVLDADVFYSQRISSILEKKENLVLTPHPKEFAELLKNCGFGNFSVKEILENSFELVKKFCEKYPGSVLLLKGSSVTIGANFGGTVKVYVNPYGTNALAKAGSGDVLSGMIAALLAQNYNCLEACVSSSLAHSFASQKVDCNFFMTPFDLINKFQVLQEDC